MERTITRTQAIVEETRAAASRSEDENDAGVLDTDMNEDAVEDVTLPVLSAYTEKLQEASRVAEMLIAKTEELERQLRLADIEGEDVAETAQ